MSDIDWSLVEESIKEILEHIGPMPYRESDFDLVPYFLRSVDNTEILIKINENAHEIFQDKKMASLFTLTVILFRIESQLTFWINMLIYYLIQNKHHDLWSEYSRDFVSKYDDITNLALDQKIKFLKFHGFNEIEKIMQKDLRNAIAHQSFEINEEGIVHIFKKNKLTGSYPYEELQNIRNIVDKLFLITTKSMATRFNIDYDKLSKSIGSLSTEDFRIFIERYRELSQKKE